MLTCIFWCDPAPSGWTIQHTRGGPSHARVSAYKNFTMIFFILFISRAVVACVVDLRLENIAMDICTFIIYLLRIFCDASITILQCKRARDCTNLGYLQVPGLIPAGNPSTQINVDLGKSSFKQGFQMAVFRNESQMKSMYIQCTYIHTEIKAK